MISNFSLSSARKTRGNPPTLLAIGTRQGIYQNPQWAQFQTSTNLLKQLGNKEFKLSSKNLVVDFL
jgi:hypothetical protein